MNDHIQLISADGQTAAAKIETGGGTPIMHISMVPGLGILTLVANTWQHFQVFATADDLAMLHMSEQRVAWMGAVIRRSC